MPRASTARKLAPEPPRLAVVGPTESYAVLRKAGKLKTGFLACPVCGKNKWNASANMKSRSTYPRDVVICHVYEGRRWIIDQHWHTTCYQEAEMPYGAPREGGNG